MSIVPESERNDEDCVDQQQCLGRKIRYIRTQAYTYIGIMHIHTLISCGAKREDHNNIDDTLEFAVRHDEIPDDRCVEIKDVL